MSYSPEAFVAELRTVLENVQTELSATGRNSARIQRCIDAMPSLAATLRQAARVDEGMVERAWLAYDEAVETCDAPELSEKLHVAMRAALEAALSAQPAERQLDTEGKRQWDELAAIIGADGDDVDDVFAKARALVKPAERQGERPIGYMAQSCLTHLASWSPEAGFVTYEGRVVSKPHGNMTIPVYLHPAAPVGVPDGAIDTRDHFGPPCVAVVFDTQENANKYRDKLTEAMQLRQNIAAAPSAPQGEG